MIINKVLVLYFNNLYCDDDDDIVKMAFSQKYWNSFQWFVISVLCTLLHTYNNYIVYVRTRNVTRIT